MYYEQSLKCFLSWADDELSLGNRDVTIGDDWVELSSPHVGEAHAPLVFIRQYTLTSEPNDLMTQTAIMTLEVRSLPSLSFL